MSLNLGIIASSRSSAPSSALLIDTYPGAAAAYSLRKLRTAYTGAAIRVRRSSDNTETDIGFNGTGELDTTALTTFVGSNSGFVTKWYDQSGNARDIAQASTSLQPNIVNAGVIRLYGTKPSLKFASTCMTNNTFTLAQPNTYFLVSQETIFNGGDRNFFDGISGSGRNALGKQANYFLYAGSQITSATVANTNKNLFASIFNFSSSFSYLNNSAIQSNVNPGSQSLQGINLGSYSGNAAAVDAFIPEFIIYNSNKSSDRAGIQTNINSFYTIY